MISADTFILVITTCPSQQEAENITAALIEKRLAACVQKSEITSTYRWQEKVECDREIKLTLKTRSDLFDKISATIKQESSYDNPEVIAIPIQQGSPDYLEWIASETQP